MILLDSSQTQTIQRGSMFSSNAARHDESPLGLSSQDSSALRLALESSHTQKSKTPSSHPTGLVILRAAPPPSPTSLLRAQAKSLFFSSTPSLFRKQQRLCLPPYRQALSLLRDFLRCSPESSEGCAHLEESNAEFSGSVGAWLRHRDLPSKINRSVLPNFQVPLESLFFLESSKFGSDFRMVCEEKSLKFLIVEGPITGAFVKQALSWISESVPKPKRNFSTTTSRRPVMHSQGSSEDWDRNSFKASSSRRDEREEPQLTPDSSEDPEGLGGADCRVRENGTQRRLSTTSFEGLRMSPDAVNEATEVRMQRRNRAFEDWDRNSFKASSSRRDEREEPQLTDAVNEATEMRMQRRNRAFEAVSEMFSAEELEHLRPQRLCILIDAPLAQ